MLSASPLKLPRGSLEEALFEDAQDKRLDRLSLEQAALIASGVSQKDLPRYIQKIDSFYNQLVLAYPMKRLSSNQKAQVILLFLHARVFKKYHPTATEIQKTLREGLYNCVSATLLFNILCERFGISTAAREVPTHVFSIFLDPISRKNIEVETTSPHGCLISGSTRVVQRNEFIYNSHLQTWKGKRTVKGVALIAVIYYNQGIYWIHEERYLQALPFYLKAYILDPDLPDLAALLTDLYLIFANSFFERKDFGNAIRTCEEALSFIKENSQSATLRKNLKAFKTVGISVRG